MTVDLMPKYMDAIKAQLGQPYVWPVKWNGYSGKGLTGCMYPRGRDCSGTVTFAVYVATDGKQDIRANTNCQKMWKIWTRTIAPEPGDLVLYGVNDAADHVMTLWSDGRVIGACGKGSGHLCTTPDIARSLTDELNPNGACVQFRSKPDYRPVLGYIRNPLR